VTLDTCVQSIVRQKPQLELFERCCVFKTPLNSAALDVILAPDDEGFVVGFDNCSKLTSLHGLIS